MQHYFENVPQLGNVAVSRHAQEKMLQDRISERDFVFVLQAGRITPDGPEVVWREGRGIRIVILLKPEPFRGAKLAVSVYRVQMQERAKS